MTAPVLGTFIGILLIGLILPDRLSRLVSPVINRSKDTELKVLEACPNPVGYEEDSPHLRLDLPDVKSGIVGMCVNEFDDCLGNCISCQMPFEKDETVWLWRSKGEAGKHALHTQCAQSHISLHGLEAEALGVLKRCSRLMSRDPLLYRQLIYEMRVLRSELCSVIGESEESDCLSD